MKIFRSILYWCAVGQHPYSTSSDSDAEGEDEPEDLESIGTSTPCPGSKRNQYAIRKRTANWHKFREEHGEGTLGFTQVDLRAKKEVEKNRNQIKTFLVGGYLK